MNSILDSPLEALAFNYLSFGFFAAVNSLWTWVAVVTAAVSFWRIRAASGCPKPEEPVCIDRSSNGSQQVSEVVKSDTVDERPREEFVPASAAAASSTTRSTIVVGGGDEDVGGVTKGKFTVYYEDDSQCESDKWTVTEEWESDEGRSDGWWESWEKVLRTKMGENGWYMYQDVTELNGNIVRFWDSGFGAFTRDSRYSNSCINVW